MPLSVHWASDYAGAIGNSLGFATQNDRARLAVERLGVAIDKNAPVAIHVSPCHRFEATPGKVNVLYSAWEAEEVPDLHRRLLGTADVLAWTATFLREPYRQIFPATPSFVVPLGVDALDFPYIDRSQAGWRPEGRKRPFRFLWVGAANARKGFAHILESWRGFTDSPNCELYLKTTDDKPRVVRTGNVIYDSRKLPTADLCRLYQRAHAFLFPSLGEGFGLTLAEAAATGLPCIYTPGTAMLDVLPPAEGLGYPVKFTRKELDWSWPNVDGMGTDMSCHVRAFVADTYDLGLKMIQVMDDYPVALHKGARAAAWVREQFTWEACGRGLVGVIEKAWNLVGEQENGKDKARPDA